MKLNVRKITSVTILTSMMLANVAPSNIPVIAYASGTEMTTEAESEVSTELLETEVETEETVMAMAASETDTTETEESVTESATEVFDETNAVESEEQETESETEQLPESESEQDASEERESNMTEETEPVSEETVTEAAPEKENAKGEVQAILSLETQNQTTEGKEPGQAGTLQKVKLSVSNPNNTDAELRLYFWDYEGTEVSGKNIPKEILTKANDSIEFPDSAEQMSVEITDFTGYRYSEQVSFQKEMEGEELLGRYICVHVPAEYAMEEVIPFYDEFAEKVVISMEVFPEDYETEYDPFLISWTAVPETAELETAEEGSEIQSILEHAEEVAPGNVEATVEEELPSDGILVESEEETESETETVTEDTEDFDMTESLSEEEFSSKRLLVMADDKAKIRKEDHIIEIYDDIYLLGFETVEESMKAYLYYGQIADAVEPDTDMEVASDDTTEKEDSNADAALSENEGAALLSDGVTRVIALLDTGVAETSNVIERVSLIDETLEGHTHGNQMAAAITSQNQDARIMSVRVIGNDGRGSVSAVVAGMEYAMEHGASIINLSLSSKRNTMNAVLEAEIQKAVSQGIVVVGAAGNNAADVMGYMPGSVEEACIIGACNKSGVRISSSNYGATVDFNVIAGTTSEAAAKFSGCVSKAGLDAIKVNEGIVYASDYVALVPDGGESDPPETEKDDLTEEEQGDLAGTEEDGAYPGKGSSVSRKVKIWTRDTAYDFAAYNPYLEDENVAVTCISELLETDRKAGEAIQAEYVCSLKSEENYWWNLYATFVYTDDRSVVTDGSSMLDTLMPSMVNQDRNAGYGGIVPEYMGSTVAGREFNVLKDDTEFDVYGLLIDYNPETFKVNELVDDGDFDVTKPGTYTVTYEMSYFLYPEYTWFVANKVNVIDKDSLEAGIYLTSKESTLMFRKDDDSHFSGYGDLVKVETSDEVFTISCIDPDYGVDLTSSSETVSADICRITNGEDGTKELTVLIPENLTGPVIISMCRPGYQAAKFFTGGGWADGEEFNLEELGVDQLSDTDMSHLEDTVLGKIDQNDDEYMEIAATWTTVESKNISGLVKTGNANTTNNSWAIGKAGGCNYGTAKISEKRTEIDGWVTSKGYDIETKELTDFNVNCTTGHDYLGLWPNRSYSATFQCYIQKNGDNYRLKITCSLHPGSDSHGNYQGFYGSKTYSSLTNGAKLRVYKRFYYPDFMDLNPDKYGYLKTTFAIYPESAYNSATKILDTTVTPESTIVLNETDADTVYGESDTLDPGTYYVVETRRIAGCTKNTDIYGPVVITETDTGVVKLHEKVNNADYASMGSNNWIYNYPMYFNGKILTKTDDSGLPVGGAIYKVEYSNADTADAFTANKTWYFKTDNNGVLSYDHSHYVESFTYGGKTYKSDAIVENPSKTVAMLPFGFVRIKEVMPPSDIYETDSNSYMIELVAQKDAAGECTIRKLKVKGNIPVSVDRLRYWKLNVEKVSKASEEVLGLKSYSLAGATFGVFSDQTCTKRVQLYSDEKLSVKVADNVFRTDASGKTPSYYLKAGTGSATYYVKELTAPNGHQLAANPVPVKVTMPADALKQKTASFTEGFSEPYDYMELDALVEKLSMHGNPVEGVVFMVCYYDDSTANAAQKKKTWYLESDANGKVLMDQSHVYTKDSSMKSDPFYTDPASGKMILPIGGYVTIQEVKAPAQYQIDDTVQGFVTKNQKVTVKRQYNELVPGKIRLKKYDQTGAKPLSGVEFELMFVKAAEIDTSLKMTYNRLLKEGETKILKTDSKGEITFDNLDHGRYEITEVKTVEGQTLLKEKITIDLPITMTKSEADKYGNVDYSSAKEDKGYTDKWFFYDCLYEITNEPQFKLPQTGGFGGWAFGYIGLGILILTGFCIFGISRRKMTV